LLGTECGYTPSEIGEMTLHDVRRIFDHWKTFPPLRVLVAATAKALGVQLPMFDNAPKNYMTAADAARMMMQTGGKIPGLKGV
jgi:hypothetical protein